MSKYILPPGGMRDFSSDDIYFRDRVIGAIKAAFYG
jgi:hypothetical protein